MVFTPSPDTRIAVIGLGYVGLPLAVEFGKRYPTIGYDVQSRRIAELTAGSDSTLEVTPDQLAGAGRLQFTDQLDAIALQQGRSADPSNRQSHIWTTQPSLHLAAFYQSRYS